MTDEGRFVKTRREALQTRHKLNEKYPDRVYHFVKTRYDNYYVSYVPRKLIHGNGEQK